MSAFAHWLDERSMLSNVYSGPGGGASVPKLNYLRSDRSRYAIQEVWRAVRRESADTFFLNLGFVNLATVVRLGSMRSRIVVRICNPPRLESRTRGFPSGVLQRISLRASAASSNIVIAQSQHMKSDLIECGVSDSKIRVIHNPVNPKVLKSEEEVFVEYDYILSGSTNKPQKDLFTLLKSFSLVQGSTGKHLVLAGVEPGDGQIAAWIRELRIAPTRVHCLGFTGNMGAWIRGASMCVSTSLYEGFSNFLLESAALGKRIVATDCPGGNIDLAKSYPNMVLVRIGDCQSISTEMLAPAKDLELGHAERCLGDYGRDKIFTEYLKAMDSTCAPR